MKILSVHSTGFVSGGERVSLDIVNSLSGRSFDFSVFSPFQVKEIYFKNIQVIYPENKGFWNCVSCLKRNINNFDLIHAHGTRAATWIKLAKFLSFSEKPVVYTIHGIHFLYKNFIIKWLAVFFEFITNRIFIEKLVCVGENDLYLARKFYLSFSDKINLIKNGIDIDFYSNFSKEKLSVIKKELNLNFKNILLTVCRLHFQKDVPTLIRAVSILKDKDVGLVVIGEGPLEKDLKKMASDLNIENKVVFLGKRDDISEFLHWAEVFVLSTKWEGLPLTLLEAMAAGIPIVASEVGGVTEIIDDGQNGFLFEAGNALDLSKKIMLLLGNDDLRKKIVSNARCFVNANYSLKRMVSEYEKIYNEFK